MQFKQLLVSLLMATTIMPAVAQLPIVDITMVPSGSDQLELRMRPDAYFDGLFAALVFTVRWESSSAATLSDFTPTPEVADYNMYPDVSGEMGEANGFKYLVYAGFGSSSLLSEGQSWTAGEEFVLGHFTIVGGIGDFEIVNDAWTAANNGDYYVSLNGVDRTGEIYELSTNVGQEQAIEHGARILPNPSNGPAQLDLELTVAGPLEIRVVDATGRTVAAERVASNSGAFRYLLPHQELSEGSYFVRVLGSELDLTLPWIVQR
jgi:hypothetical protein